MTARTYSILEAAALLGISKSHAYELARRDEFPVRVIRLGRTYRVPQVALDDLLEGR